MTAEGNRRWYAVQTQPNAEAKAERHLRHQDFEPYLPRFLKRRRHARRVETVLRPLFPRYLFVALDIGRQRWRSIHSTIGVSRLICHGDEPVCVPDGVIADLRSREDGDGLVRLETRPSFGRGDKVTLTDGPFAASMGLFEGMKDGERVAVLLELLGRKVRVEVDADFVVAA